MVPVAFPSTIVPFTGLKSRTVNVSSLSGKRGWREDHVQMCDFYQGITTHKNSYDFVTITPIEVVSTRQAMKPAGVKLLDWIAGWKA